MTLCAQKGTRIHAFTVEIPHMQWYRTVWFTCKKISDGCLNSEQCKYSMLPTNICWHLNLWLNFPTKILSRKTKKFNNRQTFNNRHLRLYS